MGVGASTTWRGSKGGRDSLRPTLTGGHTLAESLGPTLAGGHDFTESLDGGSDFVQSNKYLCEQCELRNDQIPAFGFCIDCDICLCSECHSTHLRPKTSRHHMLLDGWIGKPKNLPSCDPCTTEDKDMDAVGFCQDCADYLCYECFRTHCRPQPSRNHVLLDQSRMPRLKRKKCEIRKTQIEHVMDIEVFIDGDWNVPFLSGLVVVVPGQSLVAVDCINDSVKLIDLTRGTVQARLQLPSMLWDIALVSDSRVVVTNKSEETLYFINVRDGKLTLDNEVKVKGSCWGVASINDNLVVTYEQPTKVEILSKSGKFLQTVMTQDKGECLFTSPFHVTVSRDQSSIYIADICRDTVTRLSLTGEILAVYRDTRMDIQGLAVDKAGDVYVCCYNNSIVMQLASDLTQPRKRLDRSDRFFSPKSICYCQTMDTLYIGMKDRPYLVKVFKIKSH